MCQHKCSKGTIRDPQSSESRNLGRLGGKECKILARSKGMDMISAGKERKLAGEGTVKNKDIETGKQRTRSKMLGNLISAWNTQK